MYTPHLTKLKKTTFNGAVGMHHVDNRREQEIPLARIQAQSCVTHCLNICREELRMILLVSLVALLRGLVSIIIHIPHPYKTIHSVK